MVQQDWIGVGILASSLALLAVLLKFRFIRRNPPLLVAFIVNPGIVGVLASCAFWFRDAGTWATVLWVGAMVLTVPCTIAVMLVVPKAYFHQFQAEIAARDEAEPPSDDGQTPAAQTPR
jgi:hypothetical protein